MAAWVARPAWPMLASVLQGRGALPVASAEHRSVLGFQRVGSVQALDAALRAAAQQGRPVMLDFYADWCVSCQEMERETFTDPRVRARLAQAVLLQADVTANSADDRALLQRFGLFGPPGLVFFDRAGQELRSARVIGFQAPDQFMDLLSVAGLR
jgi:thiol:disulfide interchange protein DsbD